MGKNPGVRFWDEGPANGADPRNPDRLSRSFPGVMPDGREHFIGLLSSLAAAEEKRVAFIDPETKEVMATGQDLLNHTSQAFVGFYESGPYALKGLGCVGDLITCPARTLRNEGFADTFTALFGRWRGWSALSGPQSPQVSLPPADAPVPSLSVLTAQALGRAGFNTKGPLAQMTMFSAAVADYPFCEENSFHNISHFRETLILFLRYVETHNQQVDSAAEPSFGHKIEGESFLRALTAALIHDIFHDGGSNSLDNPMRLERRSFEAMKPVFQNLFNISDEVLQKTQTMLLATCVTPLGEGKPSPMQLFKAEYGRRFAGGEVANEADRWIEDLGIGALSDPELCAALYLHEADVASIALCPGFGREMTAKLSKEDNPVDDSAKAFECFVGFVGPHTDVARLHYGDYYTGTICPAAAANALSEEQKAKGAALAFAC